MALPALVLIERLAQHRDLNLQIILLIVRPGQIRARSWSLLTTSPLAAASVANSSSARLPSRTGTPSRHSSRRPVSNRKRPNLTAARGE
jgi:hypothetical protein